MPRYEYKCKECNKIFEVVHGFSESVESCTFCGGDVRRVFHPVGIVFKGSGFYSTDYGKQRCIPSNGNGKSDYSGDDKGGKSKKSASDSSEE